MTVSNLNPVERERLAERLAARKAAKSSLQDAKDAIRRFREAKREAGTPEARADAREALADARDDRRDARQGLREATRDLKDLERDLGLRPGTLDQFIAAHLGAVVKAVVDALLPLEGRIVEAVKEAVRDAVPRGLAAVADHVDFAAVVPGRVGQALEAVDAPLASLLGDVFTAATDEDGLTAEDLATITRDHLRAAGHALGPTHMAQIRQAAQALLGAAP